MKICFFGVGGVGGYFGSLMVDKLIDEHEIYFIARGEHKKRICEQGLLLKKSGGDEIISANPTICTDSVKDLPVCDIVILSVKSYDLERACMDISSITSEDTIILPLLNGVDISSRMKKNLLCGTVLQSCVYVGTHIESPGVIFQKGGSCKIHIGHDIDKPDYYPQPLLDLLNSSDISYEWEEDVAVSIWNKYMFIASFGLVTAAYDKTLGEILRDPALSKLTKAIMEEIEKIALKLEIALDSSVVFSSFNKAKQFPTEAKTSFQRDVESKGKLNEGDLFGGTLIRYGKDLNVPTDNIDSVYSKLLAGVTK